MNQKIKPAIVFQGPIRTLSGYGARARDFVTSLIKLGYDVEIIATNWGDTPHTGLDKSNPNHEAIRQRIIPQLTRQPDIWIQCTIPNEFQKVGKYNIGLTAGIETTLCQPEWIEGCNRMDLLLVSSAHSKHIFETSQFEKRDEQSQTLIEILKLKVPCEVVMEGVDLDVYKKTTAPQPSINKFMNSIDEEFCFLFVGHWLQGDLGADRKDIGMLINSFLNIFKKKAPQNRPALILKTSHANFSRLELHSIQDKIRTIMQLVADQNKWTGALPNIYVLHGDLSDAEMNALYNHPKIKAMVSFTKGEGFGRPLLEFTTSGKPVIASAWSGQLDFLNPEYSYLLPGQITQVHGSAVNNWIMKESGWFTVNYTYAAQIIESCHKMYDKFAEKAKKHIAITKSSFSLDAMTTRISMIFDKLESYRDAKLEQQPAQQTFKIPEKISNI